MKLSDKFRNLNPYLNKKPNNQTTNINKNIKELYLNFVSSKYSDKSEYLNLPFKIIQKLGESIENGFYFSKNIFIRKEIW